MKWSFLQNHRTVLVLTAVGAFISGMTFKSFITDPDFVILRDFLSQKKSSPPRVLPVTSPAPDKRDIDSTPPDSSIGMNIKAPEFDVSENEMVIYEHPEIIENVDEIIENPSCMNIYSPVTGDWTKECSKIMEFGYPGVENIIIRDTYVSSYSYVYRQPVWVMELLNRKLFHDFEDIEDRDSCKFGPDPKVPSQFTATNQDYLKSGYDRGHLAAFANHNIDGEEGCETFYLSNISPQVGKGFNRNIWSQLESHVRKLTRSKYVRIFVCTGILFLPKQTKEGRFEVLYRTIGKNRVAVPTHFYKIILGETSDGKLELESFAIPNRFVSDSEPLDGFREALEYIEEAAGIVMFNKIPRSMITIVKNRITAERVSTADD